MSALREVTNAPRDAGQSGLKLRDPAEHGQLPAGSAATGQPRQAGAGSSIVITGTGFDASLKDFIARKAAELGTEYCGALSKRTTHLVCRRLIDAFGSAKYLHALEWGIPVVSARWMLDSLEQGRLLPVDDYKTDALDDLAWEARLQAELRRHGVEQQLQQPGPIRSPSLNRGEDVGLRPPPAAAAAAAADATPAEARSDKWDEPQRSFAFGTAARRLAADGTASQETPDAMRAAAAGAAAAVGSRFPTPTSAAALPTAAVTSSSKQQQQQQTAAPGVSHNTAAALVPLGYADEDGIIFGTQTDEDWGLTSVCGTAALATAATGGGGGTPPSLRAYMKSRGRTVAASRAAEEQFVAADDDDANDDDDDAGAVSASPPERLRDCAHASEPRHRPGDLMGDLFMTDGFGQNLLPPRGSAVARSQHSAAPADMPPASQLPEVHGCYGDGRDHNAVRSSSGCSSLMEPPGTDELPPLTDGAAAAAAAAAAATAGACGGGGRHQQQQQQNYHVLPEYLQQAEAMASPMAISPGGLLLPPAGYLQRHLAAAANAPPFWSAAAEASRGCGLLDALYAGGGPQPMQLRFSSSSMGSTGSAPAGGACDALDPATAAAAQATSPAGRRTAANGDAAPPHHTAMDISPLPAALAPHSAVALHVLRSPAGGAAEAASSEGSRDDDDYMIVSPEAPSSGWSPRVCGMCDDGAAAERQLHEQQEGGGLGACEQQEAVGQQLQFGGCDDPRGALYDDATVEEPREHGAQQPQDCGGSGVNIRCGGIGAAAADGWGACEQAVMQQQQQQQAEPFHGFGGQFVTMRRRQAAAAARHRSRTASPAPDEAVGEDAPLPPPPPEVMFDNPIAPSRLDSGSQQPVSEKAVEDGAAGSAQEAAALLAGAAAAHVHAAGSGPAAAAAVPATDSGQKKVWADSSSSSGGSGSTVSVPSAVMRALQAPLALPGSGDSSCKMLSMTPVVPLMGLRPPPADSMLQQQQSRRPAAAAASGGSKASMAALPHHPPPPCFAQAGRIKQEPPPPPRGAGCGGGASAAAAAATTSPPTRQQPSLFKSIAELIGHKAARPLPPRVAMAGGAAAGISSLDDDDEEEGAEDAIEISSDDDFMPSSSSLLRAGGSSRSAPQAPPPAQGAEHITRYLHRVVRAVRGEVREADVNLTAARARPPRGTTAGDHHGLASLAGVIFADAVHISSLGLSLGLKDRSRANRCLVVQLPGGEAAGAQAAAPPPRCAPDTDGSISSRQPAPAVVGGGNACPEGGAAASVLLVEPLSVYRLPAGGSGGSGWWLEYSRFYTSYDVLQIADQQQQAAIGAAAAAASTSAAAAVAPAAAAALKLPADFQHSHELVREAAQRGHCRLTCVRGEVRVMRTKALPAKYRKGGRVFFHRSTLDADTMELKPLAAAATASASAPN